MAQIRSHAQKFLLKLCKKYSIKLKTKKFQNKESKHLDSVNKASKTRMNISLMSKEERNIFDMFKYYQREYNTSEGVVRENISASPNRVSKISIGNSTSNSSTQGAKAFNFLMLNPPRCITQTYANTDEQGYALSFDQTVNQIQHLIQKNAPNCSDHFYEQNFSSFLSFLEGQQQSFDELCKNKKTGVFIHQKM